VGQKGSDSGRFRLSGGEQSCGIPRFLPRRWWRTLELCDGWIGFSAVVGIDWR
jgi:hypothetical protein